MEWYEYVAYFFVGVLLANGIPHFINGITGKRFQSPFSWPPGVGESSAVANVIWGLLNVFGGYALLFGVGDFVFGINRGALMVGLGALVAAVFLSVYFQRIRSE